MDEYCFNSHPVPAVVCPFSEEGFHRRSLEAEMLRGGAARPPEVVTGPRRGGPEVTVVRGGSLCVDRELGVGQFRERGAQRALRCAPLC